MIAAIYTALLRQVMGPVPTQAEVDRVIREMTR